jgi:hypothetical protein
MHENLDQAVDIADPSENAEVTLQKTDRDKVIGHCLTKLSHDHREVLDLAYYHEEPIDSVATILGIPMNTVKTRMFYARRHLAALLAEAGIDRATAWRKKRGTAAILIARSESGHVLQSGFFLIVDRALTATIAGARRSLIKSSDLCL